MSQPIDVATDPSNWTALHWTRLVELLVLFGVMPVSLTLLRGVIPPIPVLLGVAVFATIVLLRDPTFERSTLWSIRGLGPTLLQILPLWLGSGLLIGAAVYLVRPEAFLSFPRERPWIWLIVITFYPFFSVIPQSIIYRAFFLHRYQVLFRSKLTMIIAAALAFGLAHVIFKHWLPVALTLVGGALFAWRHLNRGSTLAGAIEHAMYGNLVFTLGLGSFFYHGASRLAEGGG